MQSTSGPGWLYIPNQQQVSETLRRRYWQPATFSFQSHARNNKMPWASKQRTNCKLLHVAGKQMLIFTYSEWMGCNKWAQRNSEMNKKRNLNRKRNILPITW